MGIEILNPKTVVLVSILLTSTRIRGRNLYQVRRISESKERIFSYNSFVNFKQGTEFLGGIRGTSS